MSIFGLGRQPGQPRYDGHVSNLSVTESVYGTTLPILVGTQRLHGKLLDYYGFNAVKQSAPTGKGIFGSKGDYWEYYATVVIALAQGPCLALLNVWTYNGMLKNLSGTYYYTVPSGGGTIAPISGNAAPIQVDLGVTKQQANLTLVAGGTSGYTTASGVPTTTNGSGVGLTLNITASGGVVTAGVMANQAKGYQVGDRVYPVQAGSSGNAYFTVAYAVATNDYGGAASTITGPQNIPFKKVTGTPAAGEYAFNSGAGSYTFAAADAGSTVAISYSSMFSLYYLVQTQFDLVPSSTPYQITPDNHDYFYEDLGVTFVDTNTAGNLVSGTPSASGEYQVTIGFYNFYPGDAGRPVAIEYSYTSSDPTISSSSVLNLTFFNGAQSQDPWSYTESANPSHAFGYTLTCYMASENLDLGQTAQMPPYNYEVAGQCIYPGQQDCLISDVITLLLSDPFCGIDFPSSALDTAGTWANYAIPHWLANGFFISDILEASVGIADLLKRYCDAGNTAAFFSGGLLKLVPYSEVSAAGNGAVYTPPTTPVATLSWDNILLPSGQRPGNTLSDDYITVDEVAAVDKYNYVQANFAYRANSYNNNLINQQSDAMIALYRRRIESAQDWKFITLPAAAQWALSCRLSRGLYVDKKFKLTLPYTFDFLEPMDVLVSPTGINVRIIKIQEDENQEQQIEAENFVFGGSSASIYPLQNPNSYQPTQNGSDPGSTFPVFYQPTTMQSGNVANQINIAAAGDNTNWGGCQIWISMNGEDYSQIGTINETCALGILSASLAATADPDLTDTLSVDMSPSNTQLISASPAVANSFGTLCALISPDMSTIEFISYQNATLTATNRYNLTLLRRGVYGTPVSAFPKGSSFIYIGSYNIFTYTYSLQNLGQIIYFKLPAFNLTKTFVQSLTQCKAWAYVPNLTGSSVDEAFVPSSTSVSETGSGNPTPPGTANLPYAYDKSFATAASVNAGLSTSSTTASVEVKFSGFGSVSLAQASLLCVNLANVVAVISQELTIADAGTSGYVTANNVPTTTSGSGTGLLLNIVASGGVIIAVTTVEPETSTGYQPGDKIYPTQAGSSGDAYIELTYGANLEFGGTSGYTTATGVPVTAAHGTGMTLNIVASGGVVSSITINTLGTGYLTTESIMIAQVGSSGDAFFQVSSGDVNSYVGLSYSINSGTSIEPFPFLTGGGQYPLPSGTAYVAIPEGTAVADVNFYLDAVSAWNGNCALPASADVVEVWIQ